MFGSAAASGSSSSAFSFGAGAKPAAAPAATGTAFSFGSTAAAPTTGFSSTTAAGGAPPSSSSSAFSFGGAAAPAPSTSTGFTGFGAAPASSAAPGAGFGFGTTSGASTATSTGFSFGGASMGASGATTTPSFGFGATTANSTTKPPLFGQSGSPSGTTPGLSFGATPSASPGGFGQATMTSKPLTSAFSGGAASSFGFGGTSSFQLGGAQGAQPQTQPQPQPVNGVTPILATSDPSVAQVNTIKNAYQDPAQSRFKFLMYNTVDPTQRHLYRRPAHISERLWDQAELDNPDPRNCVPVPIVGFQDVLKRMQVQQEYADKYNTYTDDLRRQLTDMEKVSRATDEKLEKCRQEHILLFHALVKVMKDIEFLQRMGKPLQKEEMQLTMALKKLQAMLDAPAQYKARLNDAVALQHIHEDAPRSKPPCALSAEDLHKVHQFLDKQRHGLEHLTTILSEDLADIRLMKETWRR